MKHRLVLAFAVAVILPACGPQDGLVTFTGVTPMTSLDKDSRKTHLQCPKCKEPIDTGVTHHQNKAKECDTQIQWTPKPCPYCGGTSKCQACVNMQQENGDCYNCKGEGIRVYEGRSLDCPNCKGAKKCPVCKGTQQCDFCGGDGEVDVATIQSRSGTEATRAPVEEPAPEEPAPEEGGNN